MNHEDFPLFNKVLTDTHMIAGIRSGSTYVPFMTGSAFPN
jgi:hypothetical protein